MSKESLWTESEIKVEEDVLYPYVQNLLQATANAKNRKKNRDKNQNENLSNYRIYSLKDGSSDRSGKAGYLEMFLNQTSTYEKSVLQFKIQNRVNDLFSIKLIICPIAKVGLLFVPQSVVNDKTTVLDIMDFNYNLKKTDNQVPSFKINLIEKDLKRIEELLAKGEIEEEKKNQLKKSVGKLKDNINNMYSLLGLPAITERELLKQYVGFHEWIGSPKEIKKSKNGNDDVVVYKYEVYNEDEFQKNIERLNTLAAFLDCMPMPMPKIISQKIKAKDSEKEKEIKYIEQKTPFSYVPEWSFLNLRDVLISDIKVDLQFFNTTRQHIFTYYQVEEVNEVTIGNFIRIVRGENNKYMVPEEDMVYSNRYIQSFKNIYMGSSVEGSAIMVVAPPSTSHEFIKNFHSGSLSKRYLWIYLLAFMQRHSLLNLISELTHVDGADAKSGIRNLNRKIENFSCIKVNTCFTDVSDFTQHNQFYKFCMKNLGVSEHYKEVEDKMDVLHSIIKRKVDERNADIKRDWTVMLGVLSIAGTLKEWWCIWFYWSLIAVFIVTFIIFCIRMIFGYKK